MEEQWVIDRAQLRTLMQEHAEWKLCQYAEEIGRSVDWVKKWRLRIREGGYDNDEVLMGGSRQRKTPWPEWSPEVVKRICEIREEPLDNLGRTPGPVAIQYYLEKDENLLASGKKLPKSSTTIWNILHEKGYYPQAQEVEREPVERPEPLEAWQIDFKDASTVEPEPDGKKMHTIEVLDVVDSGTSILLEARPDPEYNAETALDAIATLIMVLGRPNSIRFDRDPRFVGSYLGWDFPSALIRFLLCLGIQPIVCPPHRPDLNCFVERYHRSYNSECLQRLRPQTFEEVENVTRDYLRHYDWERPNQAVTCGNLPPRVAFPELPTLPSVPPVVDPNAWLLKYHGKFFKRRINKNGSIQVGKYQYYIQKKLKGQYVLLQIDAHKKVFSVLLNKVCIKTLPIKGLQPDALITYDAFLQLSLQEARSDWQRYLQQQKHKRTKAGTM